MIFTQAECDEYLTTITALKLNHDWLSGVDKTYPLKSYTYDDATDTWINPVDEGSTFVGAGAPAWFTAWRIDNPDAVEITSEAEAAANPTCAAWTGWNEYVNDNDTYIAALNTMGEDIGKMESTHATMLATIE